MVTLVQKLQGLFGSGYFSIDYSQQECISIISQLYSFTLRDLHRWQECYCCNTGVTCL